MRKFLLPAALLALLLLLPHSSPAFMGEGCAEGKCSDCHTLTIKEARSLLKGLVDEVKEVRDAEVPGMWEVDIVKNGIAYVTYLDYSKKYLLTGNIIRIPDRKNITRDRVMEVRNIKEVRIGLEDCLVIGKKSAPYRVIVFTDPRCPFCKKLHAELKKIVEKDDSFAFFIKMYPLKIHKDAYEVAKTIVCEKSMKLLEESFEGKEIPPAKCDGKAVDENIELARKLGIRATPTMLLPDGRIVSGYKKADELIALFRGKNEQKRGEKK
ncbi:MAG: DsbC family protein [Deltaproteobacteria bacterium]|nr:MAG: DsbC family protein [Deltaproteobacteria bacterium]